jgi:hypothetical protein
MPPKKAEASKKTQEKVKQKIIEVHSFIISIDFYAKLTILNIYFCTYRIKLLVLKIKREQKTKNSYNKSKSKLLTKEYKIGQEM